MFDVRDRSWGIILLAVYLILVGLSALGLVFSSAIVGIVALAAGILLLLPYVRRA